MTIEREIDGKRSFQIEINEQTNEITVCVKTAEGYQDLALVRPHKEKGYEALVWSDAQDESYTHSFHIFPTRFDI